MSSESLDPLQEYILEVLAVAPCNDNELLWACNGAPYCHNASWCYEATIRRMEAEGHIAYDGGKWRIAEDARAVM